jgi:hypothetical protein
VLAVDRWLSEGAMSKYRVEHLGRSGPYPQTYRYAIWRGTDRVAEFEHDFRNEDRWFRIGSVITPCEIDVLSGGGPQPLEVTVAGSTLLDRLLDR